MADVMVKMTQEWLNETYGEDSRFNKIPESQYGKTGWTTIYALRRALQIEFGFTSTANGFGPATIAEFKKRFPNGIKEQEDNDETESNIYAILQGACWCKGYSTGISGITKHFYSGLSSAIKNMKEEAGCSDKSSTVTLNVMSALLSMNQFRVVSGGTKKIQEIQRNLNRDYEDYIGLIPCDGLYGRDMNKALIKTLQAVEGYSPEQSTGTFGPATKSSLPIVPSIEGTTTEKEKKAIALIRYSLCCNGYDVPIDTREWDSNLQEVIAQFQDDMLIEKTEVCDMNTWMALLLSCGNTDRDCVACDTRFEMTEEVLNYLKNNGYRIVGRYLTGGDYKELRKDEPLNIIKSGISLFPIFQESSTDIEYFSIVQGAADAKKAVKAARKYGIPSNNIIYFAVDMDVTDVQINNYILPYFKTLSERMSALYKIGVYGTRNVCSRVMNRGYAETCFVSDMSTGYSGNMGFKMPENWTFDQFKEIKNISIGSTKIDLDKVAYSNKFPAVTEVYDRILDFSDKIKELEIHYKQYHFTTKTIPCTAMECVRGVTDFLRSFQYDDLKWSLATFRDIDQEFIGYVYKNDIDLYRAIEKYASIVNHMGRALVDDIGGFIDLGHLAATLQGYLFGTTIPNHWLGWAGDLATLMKDVDNEYRKSTKGYLEIAKSLIGERSSFGYADICTDADAIGLSIIIKNSKSEYLFSDSILEYYKSGVALRYMNYVTELETILSVSSLKEEIKDRITNGVKNEVVLKILGDTPSNESIDACCEAFAQYIVDNHPKIDDQA